MYKYLPSKKFIYILFSIIIALTIIFVFSHLTNQKRNIDPLLSDQSRAKIQEFVALDSDGDGLKDWEEALWKTDAQKSDTDGDGTPDGAEIIAGRDPLKANTAKSGEAPNDKVDENIIKQNKKDVEDYSSLSYTDKIARNMFSQYIATRRMDAPLTNLDKQNIVNNLLTNLPEPLYRQYAERDLQIRENSAIAVKEYGNQVAEIILKNIKTKTENVYNIMGQYASSEAENAPTAPLNALNELINKNQITVNSLILTKVPSEGIKVHLNLINIFFIIIQDLESLKNSPKDILNTMAVLTRYEKNLEYLSSVLLQLTQYIFSDKYKVTYTVTDYGYEFFNGIILKK